MQNLKNILVGFIVSFLGSIPLGYLNVIGFEIYKQQGLFTTICYLTGVIIIELLAIYLTLIFADKLVTNIKLTKFIEGFSVVFLLTLSFIFFVHISKTTNPGNELTHYSYWKTFLSGVVLSAVNFLQIPFWTGWNLYLLNGKYIKISKSKKYFYLFGTATGTFFGMLLLILIVSHFTKNLAVINENFISKAIALLFLILGIIQIIRFYFKYKNPFKNSLG